MKPNEKGFSTVEALLLIVIVGIIGFAGWYVWHTRANSKSVNHSSSQTSNTKAPQHGSPEPGLSAYDDDFISFSYPSDWKVEKQYSFTDTYGAYLINLTAPVDGGLRAADPAIKDLYLHASIIIAKNDRFGADTKTCRAASVCTVVHVDKASIKAPHTAGSLLLSSVREENDAQVLGYSPSAIAIGATEYPSRIKINDLYYAAISADYMSGTGSDIKLATDTDFQNSTAYKQLKALLPTLTFKTNRYKLP